jgi:hypothetical protein
LSFVMYAIPLALAYLAFSWNLALGLPLLAGVAALRLTLHALCRWALGVDHPSEARLIPLRDNLTLGIWFVSLFTRTIYWRDKRYRS